MNQKELMRYYDMNLAQTKFLSGLGIMMILFGIIIVAGSLYMYMSLNGDKVLLSVGSLSGIVVDFMSSITTAVAADYRLQQWAQLVKECQNRPSDMTVEQWCDTKGISKSNYYYRL